MNKKIDEIMIIIFLFKEMSSNQRMEQKILSGGSSAVLNKVMTPSNDFDSNSLKRRKFFKIIGFKTAVNFINVLRMHFSYESSF